MRKSDLLLEEKHHDAFASEYTQRRKGDFIWEVPEEIFLLKKKYFRKKITVVDMGCGPAISVVNILGRKLLDKLNYLGIDISKEMLKLAKKNIPKGKFIKGDISNPKIKANSIDVIISLGALHHVKSKKLTLHRWSIILRRGGYILLREPTYEVLKMGMGESPIEEGIKLSELTESFTQNNLLPVKYNFFSTPAFHLFNKLLIRFGLSSWRKYKLLWFPVVVVDSFLANNIGHPFLKGGAFTLILRKE